MRRNKRLGDIILRQPEQAQVQERQRDPTVVRGATHAEGNYVAKITLTRQNPRDRTPDSANSHALAELADLAHMADSRIPPVPTTTRQASPERLNSNS